MGISSSIGIGISGSIGIGISSSSQSVVVVLVVDWYGISSSISAKQSCVDILLIDRLLTFLLVVVVVVVVVLVVVILSPFF